MSLNGSLEIWPFYPHTDAEKTAAKSPSKHKINFGWPNFFNPEMGMMREKNGKKGESDKEKEQGNDINTSLEDDEYEALIDYTLKVGRDDLSFQGK